MSHVIGLDIGGTKIFAGLYDADLNLVAEATEPTTADQDQTVTLENITKAIQAVRTEDTKAIGISWAGFVESSTGTILKAPNIPSLDGFGITDYITQQTGLPAYLENDARLFALAESAQYDHPSSFLGLIIGTGVGGGIIQDGTVVTGANNAAGEVGHMIINGTEIEAIIAGPGMETSLGVDRLSGADIGQHNDTIEEALGSLCTWLANLVLAFDPHQVVIGGGAGVHFWSKFQVEIQTKTNEQLSAYPVLLNLAFSELKNAGAQGAAVLAWRKL